MNRRATVFWKVALVLIGVQVATALLAVGLSAYFARERALELVRGNLVLRLDQVAEEVESQATFDEETGALTLPRRLQLDLVTRFPDPTYLLDQEGGITAVVEEDEEAEPVSASAIPPGVYDALTEGRLMVTLSGTEGAWAFTPLLAPDGLPAGGILIRPLDATLREEMRGTREAFVRATWTVAGLAALLALLLGALFTWRLVTPLRRMTRRVEALGAGEYADRLPAAGRDELGRLSSAINDMAAQVEASIDALQATDRMRRELVANVGHDLRTPLAALQGYLDEAARFASEGRDAEAMEAVSVARRQSQQMARLVADLFELSKLEQAAMDAGVAPLQRGPVPIAELLHDAARGHRRAFEAAAVTFDLDLPAGLPVIDADGMRLMRVLDNLLTNALRHTPEGGTVRLSAAVQKHAVEIQVADTGEGIAPERLASVFERYYQGASARTRGADGSGTGLGLAISRAIVRAHQGDLRVVSTPGQGSIFTVTLPVNPAV